MDACGHLKKGIIMSQVQGYQVVELNAVSALGHIAKNIETGNSTQWDLDYLQSAGIKLSSDEEFRIAHGLTTVEDAENLWDAALFAGAI